MGEDWSPEKLMKFSEQLEDSSRYSRDQAASWRRWALASCLSVYGAATIALLNLPAIDENSRKWAILWCVGGILFSIAFGMASAIVNDQIAGFYMKSLWTIRNFVSEKSQAGSVNIDLIRFDKLLARERRIFWFQFVSLPCFLIGIGIALEGLI